MNNFPSVYLLITNDGEYYVPCHPTLEQLAVYYTAKFKAGMPIKDIKFKCVPFNLTNATQVIKDNIK